MNRHQKELVHRTVGLMQRELAVACPVTGLLVPSGLPALLGSYLSSPHALAVPENALAVLKREEYWKSLSKELKAGLLLAILAAESKLELKSPALLVRLALESRLSVRQLDSFLSFLSDHLLTTRKSYPILELSKGVDEYDLLTYMNICADIELLSLEPTDTPVLVNTGSFISSQGKGRILDQEVREAWLEAAPFLPGSFKEKARALLSTLATNPSLVVDRMISAVETAALRIAEEVAPEVVWFEEIAVEARKKAKALGLHDSSLEEVEELFTPLPPSQPSPSGEPQKLSPLQQRLAALKAKGASQ